MGNDSVLDGKVVWPGETRYEDALRDAVWNERKPARRPAGIVLAEDAADVAAAVRLAASRDIQVSVRAGGHSWVAAGVRDGALLIDVSRLRSIEVDARSRRAVVGPGVHGGDLNTRLAQDGLFFPSGHCPTVALGGFLLGGGMGWNWRAFGLGCTLVQAVDVVTADGELIRADAHQNPDVLWAARGAGPGFFAIVTSFHLDLKPMPTMIGTAHNYPMAALGDLLSWQHEILGDMPANEDQVVYGTQHAFGGGNEPTVLLSAMAFGDSEQEARDALALFETGPVRDSALWRREQVPFTLDELRGLPSSLYEHGRRYAVDNVISNATADTLVPAVEDLFTTMPTPRTHVMWTNMAGAPKLPDMCYSMTGDTLIEAYAVWDDPADDVRMQDWLLEHLRKLEPLSTGSQMSGENMIGRPSPGEYFSSEALSRLEQLRDVYDQDRRFVSFLIPR